MASRSPTPAKPLTLEVDAPVKKAGAVTLTLSAVTDLVAKLSGYGAAGLKALLITNARKPVLAEQGLAFPGVTVSSRLLHDSSGTFLSLADYPGAPTGGGLVMASAGIGGIVITDGGQASSSPRRSGFIVVADAVELPSHNQTPSERQAAARANVDDSVARAAQLWATMGSSGSSWAVYGSVPHAVITSAPVDSLDRTTVDVAGLNSGSIYDLTVVAYDGDYGVHESVLFAGIDMGPSLSVSCALASPVSFSNPRADSIRAVIGADLKGARAPDTGDPGRTYSVYVMALGVDAVSLQDLGDHPFVSRLFLNNPGAQAVAQGEFLETVGLEFTVGGLTSGKDYYVVALAADDVTGESVHAFFQARTASVGPAVFVLSHRSTNVATTVFIDVGDPDSPFQLHAAAYLAPASGGTVPYPDMRVEADRIAHIARAANGFSGGGYSEAFPAIPGPGGKFTSFSLGGLLSSAEYRVSILVADAVGNYSYASTTALTKAADMFLDEVEYDDGLWQLRWSSAVTYSRKIRGAPLGNGRVKARQSLATSSSIGCETLTVASSGRSWQSDSNARSGRDGRSFPRADGFDPTGVTFDDPALSAADHTYHGVDNGSASIGNASSAVCAFVPSRQTLNMYTGVCSTVYDVVVSGVALAAGDPQAAGLSGSVKSVTSELYCPRTMPSFTAMTFSMDVVQNDLLGAVLYLTMSSPRGDPDAVFEGGPVFSPRSGTSVFVLSGEGGGRGGSGRSLGNGRACASVYMFSDGFDSVSLLGFNSVATGSRNTGFAAFRVGAPAGSRPSVTVLSAHVEDSDDPRSEARSMVLTALSSKTRNGRWSEHEAASKLRSEHVLAWDAAWKSGVEVVPRSLDAVQLQKVFETRRCLRQAQYTVLSSVSDDGYGSTQQGRSSGPGDGSAAVARELWVVPALVYLRPKAARALLARRFDELEKARETARAQGLDGARYTYPEGAFGLRLSPALDMMSSGYVFPSCLVSLGAWQYFLSTQDQEWLASKGYSILSSVADMLVSAATVTEVVRASGRTELEATFGEGAVLDLDGEAVTDGVLTVHFGRLAVRAAIEASYALRYPTKRAWQRLYEALRTKLMEIPVPSASRGKVYVPKPHADFVTAAPVPHPAPAVPQVPAVPPPGSLSFPPRLLDSLLVLTQHWADQFGPAPTDGETLAEAERYFAGLQTPTESAISANVFTRVGVRAQSERAKPSGTSAGTAAGAGGGGVESTFDLFLTAVKNARADVWGAPSSPANATDDDVGLSAQILLLFVTSFAGVRVEGGFSPSGTTYRPLGLRASAATSNFPKSWKSVRVRTGRDAPIRVSTGASGGQVFTEDLVVSNDVPP